MLEKNKTRSKKIVSFNQLERIDFNNFRTFKDFIYIIYFLEIFIFFNDNENQENLEQFRRIYRKRKDSKNYFLTFLTKWYEEEQLVIGNRDNFDNDNNNDMYDFFVLNANDFNDILQGKMEFNSCPANLYGFFECMIRFFLQSKETFDKLKMLYYDKYGSDDKSIMTKFLDDNIKKKLMNTKKWLKLTKYLSNNGDAKSVKTIYIYIYRTILFFKIFF